MEISTRPRHSHRPAPTPPPPRLLRSRSGTPPLYSSELRTFASNSGRAVFPAITRSKSTTRSRPRTAKDEEINNNNHASNNSGRNQRKPQEIMNKDGYVKFMQRGQYSHGDIHDGTARRARSVPSSPSAWALSPGRLSPCPSAPESPGGMGAGARAKGSRGGGGGGGGGVSGVLKYFRQRKVSRREEEEFRRFRVLQNRLVQWRFVNARAHSAIASANHIAQKKSINSWIKIFRVRSGVVEKRIEMQRLEQEIKLHSIVNAEIRLLKEWAKLENRNSEAVGKLAAALSAIPNRLTLVHGAKAEEAHYLLTELANTAKREKKCLEELGKTISLVSLLEAKEQSLRVHIMQATGV
ncbi:QWRF motif-containing protein 7 [Malania oleifera]|uniref:QWRF motif-containing protein 7 n=1 Tax=Malania oleifera TaxID=397392 RepID=UPI0025ADD4CB|nr:QWRF motif-containing protein 7 [Malania oleifera]